MARNQWPMDWKRLHLYAFICFSLCIILAIIHSPNIINPYPKSETKFLSPDNNFQKSGRRVLPGSSPPRCTSKCGKCTPCKAVHVAVPPGFKVTTEYYPEAWRCKCGNKLYMP